MHSRRFGLLNDRRELNLHRLATGGYGLNRSHRLPSGGAARVKRPPSGDRWLRRRPNDTHDRSVLVRDIAAFGPWADA